MNYFVDSDLGAQITGIEQAEFNRLKLFQEADMPATIVYLAYKPRMQEYANKFGVQGFSFTMYDYFQGATKYKKIGHYDWQTYWQEKCNYKLDYVDDYRDIRVCNQDGTLVMYASFADADYTQVIYINYFDKDRRKVRRDTYDCRGFLSRTTLLEERDLPNSEIYFDENQNIRIIKQYTINHEKAESTLSQITLMDYQNKNYYFPNEEEFRTFFFNQLFNKEDLVFVDRQSEMAKSIQYTNPEVKMIMIFHNGHVKVGESIKLGRLKFGVYDYTLAHPDRASAFVTSTDQQTADLKSRYDSIPQVYTIPVSWTESFGITEKDFGARNPHRIISIARYSRQKQLHHQVKAVERLVPEFPDIELHLLGYGQTVGAELKQYIEEHHLEKNVFLRGFQLDLTDDLRKGSLALQTSLEEGFSISTLQALSASVPVIGYDINYGPKEMIFDGQNGFLIPANDEEMLYQRMRQYLGDKDLQMKFMKNCRPLAQKFSADKLKSRWVKLVNDVNPES